MADSGEFSDLSELIGALLTSMTHARRISDEETAAVAARYKEHPLLSGMSVPRMRVPELVLELPVMIKSHETGRADSPETAPVVPQLVSSLNNSAKRLNVELPRDFTEQFTSQLKIRLQRQDKKLATGNFRFNVETVRRDVILTFREVVDQMRDPKSRTGRLETTRAQENEMLEDLEVATLEAFGGDEHAPVIKANILTSDVKEQADPQTVSRLRIIMREEGLEWQVSQGPRGEEKRTLSPE